MGPARVSATTETSSVAQFWNPSPGFGAPVEGATKANATKFFDIWAGMIKKAVRFGLDFLLLHHHS